MRSKFVGGLILIPSLLQAQNPVFQEANGLLVMEAESITTPAPWAKRTSADIPAGDPQKLGGFTGTGFIEWTGQQYFGLTTTNPDTPIRYNFEITNPGTYKLVWRTKQKDAGQTFDAGNDAFVRFATGTIPAGGRNFGIFTKIYVQNKNNWEVSANAEPGGNPKFVFNNFSRVLTAGNHAVELSGRSPGHVIDRIILHRTDVPFNATQFATAPESTKTNVNIDVDSVSGVQLEPSVSSANSFTVNVPYTATTSRDVNVAIVQPGGTPSWRGAGKTTVSAGSDTATITVNVTNPNTDPLTPGSYQWVASIREVGLGFETNKDEVRVNFTVESNTPPPPPIPAGESAVLKTLTAGVYGELKQWHRVTTAFEGPNLVETGTSNPFNDYRLDVTFTHTDSGQEITVPGYFAADGEAGESGATQGTIWRAHLRPWLTGQWNYTSRFINGSGAAINNTGTTVALTGGSGSFFVGESDKMGVDFRNRGRLTYVNKHHLRFSGSGEYFLKYGADSPENVLAYADIDNTPTSLAGERNTGILHTWQPHVTDWRRGDPEWKSGKGRGVIGAMNYLREQGAKSVSMLLYTTDGGDDGRVFPWISKSNKASFDTSKLDQWEVIFEHANASGLNLSFKLAEEENWPDTSGNDLTRYYREMVARFGHHLGLTWIISEEYGGFGDHTNEEVQELIRRGNLLANLDPWENNLVTHTGPGLSTFGIYQDTAGEPAFTGASLQIPAANSSQSVFDRTLLVRNWSKAAGRPWVVANDEQNPANSGVLPDVEGNRKNVVWGNIMAGGAGLEYYTNNDVTNYDATIEDWRELDHMWTWSNILINGLIWRYQVPFWDMENQDSLLSGAASNSRCFALTDDTYLIYLPSGGSANLNLTAASTGNFQVKWYDPRNGGSLLDGNVTTVQGGGVVALGNAPNSTTSDWAVLVRNATTVPSDLGEYDPNTVGNCPIAFQMFAQNFPTANNDFYLDNTALLTDVTGENALAINPSNATTATTSTAYNGPAGRYDLIFRAVGENDGSSTFVIKVNGTTLGTHNPPISTEVFEIGSRYNVRYNNIDLSPGDIVEVSATIASLDGEFSRARWLGIDFLQRCRAGGNTNFPPIVQAGSSLNAPFVSNPTSVVLQGSVSDDGLPEGGTLTHTWSKVSGPGTVTFGDANSLRTLASFSAQGTYLLRLTANDGQLTSSSNVNVSISDPTNVEITEFNAVDDAYLQNGALFNNAELRVESSTSRTRISYLKFDLSSLTGALDSVTLRLTEGTDVSSGNMTLRFFEGGSNTWTESDLSTANAPTKGTQFAVWTGNIADGAQVEVDASSFITGAGVYSVIVEADSSPLDVGFSSSEGASSPKILVSKQSSFPLLNFDSPTATTALNSLDPVTVNVSVDPVASTITEGELFVDGASQGVIASGALTWNIGQLSVGNHTLVVLGKESSGKVISNSLAVNVTSTEYNQWKSSNFLPTELSNPAISGNDADPGGNGLPNIVDFALGIDPKGSLQPKLKMDDVSPTDVMVSYDRKSGDRAGVVIRLLYSSDLSENSWQDVNNYSTQVSPGGVGIEKAMHTVPRLQNADKQFYRLYFEY